MTAKCRAACEMATGTTPQSSICRWWNQLRAQMNAMTHLSTETDNQSIYNVAVPQHYNEQKASYIEICIRPLSPDQLLLTLSLFVSRILADYSDTTLSLDDLTFFANRFYWRSNFHSNNLLSKSPLSILPYLFYSCKSFFQLFSIFSIFEKSRKNVLISKKIATSALYNFQKTFLPYHLVQPFTYSIKSVKQFLLLRHLIQTFIYPIKNVTQFLLVSHYKHFLFT